MWVSNYTFEEIAVEIEQYGTDREREIVKRAFAAINERDEEVELSRAEELCREIMENTMYAVNDELAKAVRDLVIDLVEAKGGKRKSREALNWFIERFEDNILPDERDMLSEFMNIVGKALG